MNSGIAFGNASTIDGLIERIEDEIGMSVTTIATGGLAKFIVPYCKKTVVYDADLMLKGLFLIYNKNEKTSK